MTRRLAHDLFLLSLADGRRTRRQQVAFGLAGAVLADLALDGLIDLDGAAVVLRSTTPATDRVLNAALTRIAADKQRPLRQWVEKLRGEVGVGVVAETSPLPAWSATMRAGFWGSRHTATWNRTPGRPTGCAAVWSTWSPADGPQVQTGAW